MPPMSWLNRTLEHNATARSAGGTDSEDLRALLHTTEVADLFDAATQRRIGETISTAIFNPARDRW